MEIKVWEEDWVHASRKKDVYLSIRDKTFETKKEAERDSHVCIFMVLYHLGRKDGFTEDGEFLGLKLDYQEATTMLDSGLLAANYHLEGEYAKATREDLERVEQIMGAIQE